MLDGAVAAAAAGTANCWPVGALVAMGFCAGAGLEGDAAAMVVECHQSASASPAPREGGSTREQARLAGPIPTVLHARFWPVDCRKVRSRGKLCLQIWFKSRLDVECENMSSYLHGLL